jgi:hypothetical protein
MLRLGEVTLAAIDCVQPAAAALALERCTASCRFAEVLLFTDSAIVVPGARTVAIAPLRSRAAYSEFVLKRLASHIDSAFVLLVQWDGFIRSVHAWRDQFLAWDYIGAPWGHGDGMDVGNGGFSLRSAKLLRACTDPAIDECEPEDDRICRTYRPYLEVTHGIRFAPVELARRFSVEHVDSGEDTFGFHGPFNLWRGLDGDGLLRLLDSLPDEVLARPDMLGLAYRCWQGHRVDDAVRVLGRIVERQADHAGARLMLTEIRAELDQRRQ